MRGTVASTGSASHWVASLAVRSDRSEISWPITTAQPSSSAPTTPTTSACGRLGLAGPPRPRAGGPLRDRAPEPLQVGVIGREGRRGGAELRPHRVLLLLQPAHLGVLARRLRAEQIQPRPRGLDEALLHLDPLGEL